MAQIIIQNQNTAVPTVQSISPISLFQSLLLSLSLALSR